MDMHQEEYIVENGLTVLKKLKERRKQVEISGKKIYDMSIGTPDIPPAKHIINALIDACKTPENFKYALNDLPELQRALIDYYQKRYSVCLDQEELTTVNGTQEALTHLFLMLCKPNDYVLIPEIGFPIFRAGPELARARICTYSLLTQNNYIPDLSSIPEEIAWQAKAMIISYPLNPIGKMVPDCFYNEVIKFAKKYNITIIHDNAYSNIVFQERKGKSFLEFDGAREVGIELLSLSKSYNLSGARVGFVVGNREIIRKFKEVKAIVNYGMFLPVQHAAIAALMGEQSSVDEQCKVYKERGIRFCQGLRACGWKVEESESTMFIWGKIPNNFSSSENFCFELLDKTGIVCTPGICFGKPGKNYVRFALIISKDEIDEVINLIKKSNILVK